MAVALSASASTFRGGALGTGRGSGGEGRAGPLLGRSAPPRAAARCQGAEWLPVNHQPGAHASFTPPPARGGGPDGVPHSQTGN